MASNGRNGHRAQGRDPDRWAEGVLGQLAWVDEPYRSRYAAELKRQLQLNGQPLAVELVAAALRRMPSPLHRARLMQELDSLLNHTVAAFGISEEAAAEEEAEVNREA